VLCKHPDPSVKGSFTLSEHREDHVGIRVFKANESSLRDGGYPPLGRSAMRPLLGDGAARW
jgi:hypothetical protein